MRLTLLLCLIISLSSCKSTKTYRHKSISKKTSTTTSSTSTKAEKIASYAKTYEGVKYQYGGTTQRGMDCSGLIFVAFRNENVVLPRVSRDMAKRGKEIRLKEVKIGDLLFFKTKRKQGKINHVGLVVNVNNSSIEFIHSTTSRGVITSLLSENYWRNAFVKARRVL